MGGERVHARCDQIDADNNSDQNRRLLKLIADMRNHQWLRPVENRRADGATLKKQSC
jgi:hypothetical protein